MSIADRLSQADDRELLKRHVSGDPDAFSELFRRHRNRLWAVALRTAGNPEDAADALQDAMIKAFRAAATFRGDSAVTTWLHRVVVNACLDQARRAAVRPATSLPDGDRSDLLAASAPDPMQTFELHLDVTAALATLPAEQRAALVLVDMQGFSVEETAQILECAPGTVKSRCARGRARLLPLLASLRSRSGTDVKADPRGEVPDGRNQEGPVAVTFESGSAPIRREGGQPA